MTDHESHLPDCTCWQNDPAKIEPGCPRHESRQQECGHGRPWYGGRQRGCTHPDCLVEVGDPALITPEALAVDLVRMHRASAIDLHAWANAAWYVDAFYGRGWRDD